MSKTEPRWFAIVYKRIKLGYALDYYPNEKTDYEKDEGDAIIGDFSTKEEAMIAIRKALGA